MAPKPKQPERPPVARPMVVHASKINAGGRWYFSDQTFDEIKTQLGGKAPFLDAVDHQGRRVLLNTQAVIAVEDLTRPPDPQGA